MKDSALPYGPCQAIRADLLIGTLLIAAAFLPSAASGQTPTILLGNASTPGRVLAQGYSITPKFTQTNTTTSISYTVTSPSGEIAPVMVAKLLYEVPLPGLTPSNVTIQVTWTGSLSISGDGNAIPYFTTGYLNAGNGGPVSNQQTFNTLIKGGVGSFSINCASLTSETSTLTLDINVGNPSGGRKPYVNDFEGLGYTDFAVWRPPNGTWYTQSQAGYPAITQWGLPGDVPVPGDYDGDGIADVAVWRPSEQNWYVTLSSTGAQVKTQWGEPGDFPIAGGDYDGDGKTDYAVWRPSQGSWYVLLSSNGAVVVTQFGLPGDIPLVGNFDGDAKTDYVVWRPSEGNWYVLPSSTGVETVTQWGLTDDIPVPGDYDRDGKTDYAIWRPSTGTWWVRLSGSGGQIATVPWGLPGDIPVPGDYNGDGITDYAVWRPSDGNWWVFENGTLTPNPPFQWGLTGDVPVGYTLTSAPGQ